jgi:hypothetical protein
LGTTYEALGGGGEFESASPRTAGTKEHVAFAGNPVQEKSTPPVRSDSDVTVIVDVPGFAAEAVMEDELSANVNVGKVTINCVADDTDEV